MEYSELAVTVNEEGKEKLSVTKNEDTKLSIVDEQGSKLSLLPSSETDQKDLNYVGMDFMEAVQKVYDSGLLPTYITTPQKAIAVALRGREIGLGIMTSFDLIYVIEGKTAIDGKGMAALINRAGHSFHVVENFAHHFADDGKTLLDIRTTIAFKRKGDLFVDDKGIPVSKMVSFTMSEATKLGLTNKDNWKKQGPTMLMWRCLARGCRLYFPECLAGMYLPEELDPDRVVETD